MNFKEKPTMKPETLEHTKQRVEKSVNVEMPISFAKLEEMSDENEQTRVAFSEMLRYSQLYIADVWEMKMLLKKKDEYSDEEWAGLFAKADDSRTRLHNTFIDSIAILSRALNKAELDTEWVKTLAPTGKLDRACCGNFAIMLVYSQYVNSN